MSTDEITNFYNDKNSFVRGLLDRHKRHLNRARLSLLFVPILLVISSIFFFNAVTIIKNDALQSYEPKQNNLPNLVDTLTHDDSVRFLKIRNLIKKIETAKIFENLNTGHKATTTIDGAIGIGDSDRMTYHIQSQNSIDISFSLTLIVIRLMIVALTIYLLHILFRLYRYNIRLSTFYDSRANAIVLNSIDEKISIEKAQKLLSADRFDMAIEKIPLDSLVEIFTKAAETSCCCGENRNDIKIETTKI